MWVGEQSVGEELLTHHAASGSVVLPKSCRLVVKVSFRIRLGERGFLWGRALKGVGVQLSPLKNNFIVQVPFL